MHYKGSCHCGSVKFEFDHAGIDKGLRCNCSICRRKGALMSPFTLSPSEFVITAQGEDSLNSYRFGTATAEHFFCDKCGVYTFHETRREPGRYRVNLGCVEDLDIFALEVAVFDGASL